MTEYRAFSESGARIGQSHPNARYTDREVDLMLELKEQGYGSRRIARMMDVPRQTVASILSGRRRCVTVAFWRKVQVHEKKD